ncbi:tetratricopeptide repeat protein [Spartinivicinus ruber]|uniref:tetratricopeptide repeat protein n=1 Tax=Spartinivicinus ruber TaxID=2683272 RepID=UPI0013D65FDF|nr:tetratricopeptide repeat protein [Spartinivicinus ruber]
MVNHHLPQQLVELGFIAIRQGMNQQAQQIFKAMRQRHPQQLAPVLGLALLKLNENQPATALEVLQGFSTTTEHDMLQAYRALCLIQLGHNNEAEQLLNTLVNSAEPTVAPFAQSLLKEITHD